MARKKTPADRFRERLNRLSNAIPENLRLPSLEENRPEGYAYLYRLVLPLFNARGSASSPIRSWMNYFGSSTTVSGAAWWRRPHRRCPCGDFGTRPGESQAARDYLTTAEVLANPIEAANRFLAGLKPILKTAAHIEQQEILISRIECRLM